MGLTLFRLITAALLPVVVTFALYQADQKSRFGKLPYTVKQIIIGVCFGTVAILATVFGIPVNGAVVNVRSAPLLTAGLVFGWPASLLSASMGAVHRFFYQSGDYTRIACTVGALAAGVIGAGVRKFMMEDRKATWFYGLAVGVTAEVLHMLMVFIFGSSDVYHAFAVVRYCAIPMIFFNGLSVMLSIVLLDAVIARQESDKPLKKKISQTFRHRLLVCVLLAFAVTLLFTGNLQSTLAFSNTDYILRQNIDDVQKDIAEAADDAMLHLTRRIAEALPATYDSTQLKTLAWQFDVAEIHVVDENGINIVSSDPTYEGFDFASGEQSAAFLCLLNGEKEYVQAYQPISADASISRKYAGIALEEGGFLQAGFDSVRFQREINQQVDLAARNRHIGQNGCVIICDEQGVITSDRNGHEGEHIALLGESQSLNVREMTRFVADVHGVPSYCMYTYAEGYYIVSVLPQDEVMFSRDVAVYILAFMEVIVFAALFANVFGLIDKLIVKNIRKVNASLSKITGGNLDVIVDVRDNAEFASLSDGINTTVAALRHYIDEAAAQYDKDLEIAKLIQQSSLPSVFPPYPHRKDFSIFASMDPAKEVGGDFYDFYLLDEKHLAFLVADVSGKGIPAAMLMMTAKSLIKSYAESGLPVNEVFERVNRKLCENNEAGMFITAWMGILDLDTCLIRYANAGHNPPVVRQGDSGYTFLKSRANLVLGGMDGLRYREQQLQLQPGDAICLYTDGVTEAHNTLKELFDNERLLQSLNADPTLDPQQVCKKIKADVDAFAGKAEQFDDITMLCVQLSPTGDKRMYDFEPVMTAMEGVTAFVEQQLEEMDIPMPIATKLLIAVDEIASNIVRYSGASSAQLCIEKTANALQLVFKDNGKPYNPLDAEEPDISAPAEERSIGGLGLLMVRKLMDGTEYMYKDGQNVLTLTKNL